MEHPAVAALFVVLLWWGSTGIIFYLDGLPRTTHRLSLLGATGVGLAGLWGLVASAGDPSAGGAYLAVASAIAVWGWHELSFLMGLVTGPRRHACAPGCHGWRHFRHGVEAILYHELAIAATAGVIALLTWGGANPTGLWVFLALWAMRLSAKLNLHFGVPNTAAELLPEHMSYLGSFFSRGRVNLFFPVSVTLGTIAVIWLLAVAIAAPAGSASGIGNLMLATLVALAVFEHWLLILEIPASGLWRWALGPRARPEFEPEIEADEARLPSMPSKTTHAELRAQVVTFPRGG